MKKHITDALLIVFSVLLALGINSAAENRKTTKKKRVAKERLIKELKANKAILNIWHPKHKAFYEKMSSVAFGQNDSLRQLVTRYDFLRFDLLFGEPLISELTNNTAWQTVTSSGLVQEFEFETIQKLSESYSMLDAVNNKTIYRILETFYDKSSLVTRNFDETSVQFALMLGELVGQENFLMPSFDQAIEALEKE